MKALVPVIILTRSCFLISTWNPWFTSNQAVFTARPRRRGFNSWKDPNDSNRSFVNSSTQFSFIFNLVTYRTIFHPFDPSLNFFRNKFIEKRIIIALLFFFYRNVGYISRVKKRVYVLIIVCCQFSFTIFRILLNIF